MKQKNNKGFTLTEILIVVGIIVLLSGIVVASIQRSRQKSADLEVKNQLAGVQVEVQQFELAPGVTDYAAAFSAKGVSNKLAALAEKLGVVGGEYEYATTPTEYAIIFPLKTEDSFYCVDSKGASREVVGLLNTTGPRSCDNATRIVVAVGGGGTEGEDNGGGGGTSGSTTKNDSGLQAFAGYNEAIVLPTNSISLEGGMYDPSSPTPTPQYERYWSQVSGPSTVTIPTDPFAYTKVTLNNLVEGRYVFRYNVKNPTNGDSTHDQITVAVEPVGVTAVNKTVSLTAVPQCHPVSSNTPLEECVFPKSSSFASYKTFTRGVNSPSDTDDYKQVLTTPFPFNQAKMVDSDNNNDVSGSFAFSVGVTDDPDVDPSGSRDYLNSEYGLSLTSCSPTYKHVLYFDNPNTSKTTAKAERYVLFCD